MKFDDHLLGGLTIGIAVGLHYGASLSAFMPIFLLAGLVFLLRLVKIR